MKKKAAPKAGTLRSKAIAKGMGVSPIEGAFDEIVELIRAARQQAARAVLSPPKLSTALRELHPAAAGDEGAQAGAGFVLQGFAVRRGGFSHSGAAQASGAMS